MTFLDDIAGLLHEQFGWSLTASGMTELRRSLCERCEATGMLSLEEYRHLLAESDAELRALVECTVVPETFFFRYPESFAFLAQWAENHHPLRILSFACSTGEEPYSIAMSLLDSGRRDFLIEARDISVEAIAAAAAARYPANSFREDLSYWKERYFALSGDGWRVDKEVREHVTFRVANLLDMEDRNEWDIIFCRNVLIYFSPLQQKRAVERLEMALKAGGLLFLGPAEPAQLLSMGWKPIRYPMSFVCAKSGRSQPPLEFPKVPERVKKAPVVARAVSTRKAAPSQSVAVQAGDALDRARKLADAGKLDEAEKVLAQVLAKGADAHFLQGLIDETRSRDDLAEASYRKALYLDPAHADALLHMSLLLERHGRIQAADNMRRRALAKEKAS